MSEKMLASGAAIVGALAASTASAAVQPQQATVPVDVAAAITKAQAEADKATPNIFEQAEMRRAALGKVLGTLALSKTNRDQQPD
ncbi:hypothetical protein [Caenimonas koreensis]|uniref:Uncharacterized protein n=1 Tax=Caenimonas koreensis DSM 17982 TaxID=1121255 RepID=A0A844B4D1_9BURK|nr:hypothetical protein [Caenimonas koreensis]MRD49658.1 hypothetical protein [Caenimonas koreensis DSM 17982]